MQSFDRNVAKIFKLFKPINRTWNVFLNKEAYRFKWRRKQRGFDEANGFITFVCDTLRQINARRKLIILL